MGRKFFIVFVLLFSYFFFVPQALGVSNEACDDNSPASKPVLISAVPGEDSVTLTWTEAQDPVTHYLVAYGRSETEVEYGNPNVGGKGTTTYMVSGLAKGVKYYFKVRPVNGCRPGDFSNKLPAIPGLSVSKGVVNKPNLSIYKPVQGISVSPTPSIEVKTSTSPVITNNESSRCSTCVSWQLLIVEVIILVLYLYFAKKPTFLKPVFSMAIPILMYVLFWKINQGCLSKEFACKYFIPLDVIIFIVIIFAYKNKYINFKAKVLGQFFENKKGGGKKK